MKPTTQAIVAFAAGAIITVSIAIALWSNRPPTPPTTSSFSAMRIEGRTLVALYNGNFSKLTLNFVFNPATQRFILSPAVSDSIGGERAAPGNFMSVLPRFKSLSGDRILQPFYLEHFRLHGQLQLQTLVALMTANDGGYLKLDADDYGRIDAAHPMNVYYKISAFNASRVQIGTGTLPRAMQLNPSPPGRFY